jgi:hypothetical protein
LDRRVKENPPYEFRVFLAYKAENRAKRRETLRQLTELDQELGLF